MNRRKYLATIGTLAAGSAGAIGTGAFTSVEAERSVTVEVAGDSSAYLALQNGGGPNSNDYLHTTETGVASLDFSETDIGGSGLNTDATTVINDLLTVVNQGPRDVDFYLTFGDNLDGFENRVTFSTDDQGGEDGLLGSEKSIVIPAGESITLDLEVDVPDKESGPNLTHNSGTITFNAEASDSGESS